MVTINPLVGSNKIKDEYTKINTNITNLNNGKVEKTGDTMSGNLAFTALRGLECRSGDTDTTMDLVNFPEVSTGSGNARFFRNTNTSGDKTFSLCQGNGTTAYAFRITNGAIEVLNSTSVTVTAGSGSPEGNVAAPPGSVYFNSSGGTNTTLYVKRSGSGNTGWFAVA